MKKTLYILSALLLGLVSCTMTELETLKPKEVEPTGLVAITMKADIPMLQAYTRALGVGEFSDTPSIKDIHVAVFGTSGYPQAYALAEPVNAAGQPIDDYATENGVTYYFKVLLPVYEGEAHVHIIANGPESIPFVVGGDDMDEESIMATMKSESPVGAYWARIIMPDGILTQLDDNGIMKTDDEGNFIPSDGTAHLFQELVLVRNFAEVKLLFDSQVLGDHGTLRNITWTLVNVPKEGSVAPMADGAWVDDFKNYEYNAQTGKMVNGSKVYDGFMFDDAMDFSVPTDDKITTPATGLNFLYERPYPGTEKATCILMKAQYSPDGVNYDSDFTYYRIDLMDEALEGYFPIYRNFRYQVRIHKVGNRGATTIQEAMNRDSGGNVSLSTEARKLTDISDGESRLYVEYVEKNFTSGGKKSLWVYYVPDVSTGVIDNTNVSISVKTQGTALVEGTAITLAPASSTTGTYFYEFELNEQSQTNDLESVLLIKAHNTGQSAEPSTLFREITVRVLKKMDMELSLNPKKLANQGESTILGIELPDNLPSSMFPLEFHIEDVNHTLYASGYDGNENSIIVPVKTDKSIVDGVTNSFYFIRTVNESEYKANHIITTEFTTNKDASATTIYVSNEYFKTQSINLLNDGMYVNPEHLTVPFNTTSVEVQVEFAEPDGKSWTVAAGNGITSITDKDGNAFTGGTGNGKFYLHFPVNNSTTASPTRTATVTYGGKAHTVTITQTPLQFSITTDTPEVNYNATTATVTIHAEEGKEWTASITGPNGVTGYFLSETSGTGTKSLTVTLPANGTTVRNYTITARQTDPAGTANLTIIHRRQPNASSPFRYDGFGITDETHSGEATSTDGFITVSFANSTRPYYIWSGYAQYIQMNNGGAYGYATITPHPGVRITRIDVTGTNETYAGRISVSSGTYSTSGATRTWTVNSTEPVTMTSTMNGQNAARITNIVVYYEPI